MGSTLPRSLTPSSSWFAAMSRNAMPDSPNKSVIEETIVLRVEEGDARLAEQVRDRGDDRVAQLALEVRDRVDVARAADVQVEGFGIGNLVGIDPERTHAHRAELLVADGDRVRGAPLLVELQARREKV